MSDSGAAVPPVYVAAGSQQRFLAYCRDEGLDLHTAYYVDRAERMMGVRSGTLVVLPDFYDRWDEMVQRARLHGMEVVVI